MEAIRKEANEKKLQNEAEKKRKQQEELREKLGLNEILVGTNRQR